MGFIESGGSIVEASKRYEIARSTVYEWKRLLQETASLAMRPLNRKAYKISEEELKQRVAENPDMLQKEHAQYFKVRVQSIGMALQRLGITRKKRPLIIKSAMSQNEKNTVKE